jgi:hypothetical protein
LNIEICDLFEIWCLRFGIFNTLISFPITLAAFHFSGGADPPAAALIRLRQNT